MGLELSASGFESGWPYMLRGSTGTLQGFLGNNSSSNSISVSAFFRNEQKADNVYNHDLGIDQESLQPWWQMIMPDTRDNSMGRFCVSAVVPGSGNTKIGIWGYTRFSESPALFSAFWDINTSLLGTCAWEEVLAVYGISGDGLSIYYFDMYEDGDFLGVTTPPGALSSDVPHPGIQGHMGMRNTDGMAFVTRISGNLYIQIMDLAATSVWEHQLSEGDDADYSVQCVGTTAYIWVKDSAEQIITQGVVDGMNFTEQPVPSLSRGGMIGHNLAARTIVDSSVDGLTVQLFNQDNEILSEATLENTPLLTDRQQCGGISDQTSNLTYVWVVLDDGLVIIYKRAFDVVATEMSPHLRLQQRDDHHVG